MNVGAAVRATITFLIFILLHYTLRVLLCWHAPMDFAHRALLPAALSL